MEVVITVHGIETLALWNDKIRPVLSGIDDFIHQPHTYGDCRWWQKRGKYRLWRVFFDRTRSAAESDFLRAYDQVIREYGVVPSIIAHSFGTYIVASVLDRHNFVRYDAVVLCGSIVDRDFAWDPTRVRRVLNDVAGKDAIVGLLARACVRRWIPGSGASGREGFRTSPDSHIRNAAFPTYSHSTHFITSRHCRDYWVPFILDTEKFKALCQACHDAPHDAGLHEEFDRLHGPLIHKYVTLFFRDLPPARQRDAARTIRRFVIDRGRHGRDRPHRVVLKYADAVHAETSNANEV